MIRSKDNFLQVSDGAWIYFEDLSADHRLVLIDWRGHGSSSKTLQNLTMDRCAKDVHELIEYLGLEDVTLLGWSMGSSVVMESYEQFGDEHL